MIRKETNSADLKDFKWPVTFKKVATAVAFSPTALAVMHEAIRIARKFGSHVYFIHAGKKTVENEKKLTELLTRLKCNKEYYDVIWRDEAPTTAILNACEEFEIDLLIAGALQRENFLQLYKGSVARKLCRKANCSLLLLTHPSVESKPCKKIIVNGLNHPKTNDTIRTAFYVANALSAEQLLVAEEIDPDKVGIKCDDDLSLAKANRKKANIARDEHHRFEQILNEIPLNEGLKVKEQCIFGKAGYSIGHYTRKNNADLLVMNSPDTKLGFFDRVFTHDLEFILSDLPTDLLLVHSTRKKK